MIVKLPVLICPVELIVKLPVLICTVSMIVNCKFKMSISTKFSITCLIYKTNAEISKPNNLSNVSRIYLMSSLKKKPAKEASNTKEPENVFEWSGVRY